VTDLDERLRRHIPSAALRARAEAEGIDLDDLKRNAPSDYMALAAGEVVRAAPDLAQLAGAMLLAAFPEREVFGLADGRRERLLVFPPLSSDELERFDALLAPLTDRPEWRRRHLYFRQVDDARGVRRELDLPQAPEDDLEGDAVVGPFADEADADAWGRAHVRPPLVHDPFVMNGHWFCDVFRADDGSTPAR
jgi:hypothetical protein